MAEGISGQSLAGLFDLDIRSITELARSGIVVGSGVRGRYLLAPSVRNYVRHLREVAAGRQGNELNAVDENARLKMAQRENYELKNSIIRGSSIPYEAIAPAWARVVRAIRSAMLAVPGKARFRLQHLTPRDAEVLNEIIRDQLTAAALTDEPPPIEDAHSATRIVHEYPADRLTTDTLRLLKPPPRLSLPDWVEAEFRLPERSSAQPGRFNLWRYQRGWLEAIGDPLTPRVTLMKAARLGFSKCLIATIGSYACNDPCSVILLVPTDDDARRYAVDEVEPSFEESPVLHDLIQRGRLDGRNTLVMKSFNAGGSLKILAARAPRNLRMHDAKVLLIDEADAMEITIEGDPILLAEKRTVAHPDRKIVCGSTPTSEDTSVVARRFDESTQEIFEVPCPECGAFNEISWSNIEWDSAEPETAKYMCPHCKTRATRRGRVR